MATSSDSADHAAGRRGRMRRRDRETAWIRCIARAVAPPPRRTVRVGIGDDAAVIIPRSGRELVLTVDAQAEGTHFLPRWLSAQEIGARAVTASISDLAAMAASPVALLVSILVERERPAPFFKGLYRGIDRAARSYGAPIVGGNVSRGPLSITVTALGDAPRGESCLRSGLERGDELWVTGNPGLARLGALAIEAAVGVRRPQMPRQLQLALRAFRAPRARIGEAIALTRVCQPHAMIDLSDGLGRDLGHLLAASPNGLGITVEADFVSGLTSLAECCRRLRESPLDAALVGGEDYELCFAIAPGALSRAAARRFERRFSLPLTRIGAVSTRPGLWIRRQGRLERWTSRGFEHFAK